MWTWRLTFDPAGRLPSPTGGSGLPAHYEQAVKDQVYGGANAVPACHEQTVEGTAKGQVKSGGGGGDNGVPVHYEQAVWGRGVGNPAMRPPPAPLALAAGLSDQPESLDNMDDQDLGEARGTIVAIAASLGLPPARIRAALPAELIAGRDCSFSFIVHRRGPGRPEPGASIYTRKRLSVVILHLYITHLALNLHHR